MGYKHSREDLLAAAARLAATSGIGSLTFGSVGASLGISDRTVGYYFPTKADMITAVIAALGEQLQTALADAFGGQEAGDAVGRLGALGDPGLDRLELQHDARRRAVLGQERVVGADLLDEAAVAGRVAVSDDDRVVGALLGAATGETDLQHFG
jgi:AcrR family transcriptional regulator